MRGDAASLRYGTRIPIVEIGAAAGGIVALPMDADTRTTSWKNRAGCRGHGSPGNSNFGSPVETTEGNPVGSLAMYFHEPRKPSDLKLDLAASLTHMARIIIWRHMSLESSGTTFATALRPIAARSSPSPSISA
jgi:hypothetical protein